MEQRTETTDGFRYPVAVRALQKWSESNLSVSSAEDGTSHLRFHFDGSTCTNGGTPFSSVLHARLASGEQGVRILEAWVEIPDEQLSNAREMCGYRNGGSRFLEVLAGDPGYVGRLLDEVLLEEIPINHAGCYCTKPMINQKWRMALSTMRYALSRRSAGR